jgi:NADH:ubiquinone oxidoreductase subunit D
MSIINVKGVRREMGTRQSTNIMEYVQRLEGEVREYKELAEMNMIWLACYNKPMAFVVGVVVGSLITLGAVKWMNF